MDRVGGDRESGKRRTGVLHTGKKFAVIGIRERVLEEGDIEEQILERPGAKKRKEMRKGGRLNRVAYVVGRTSMWNRTLGTLPKEERVQDWGEGKETDQPRGGGKKKRPTQETRTVTGYEINDRGHWTEEKRRKEKKGKNFKHRRSTWVCGARVKSLKKPFSQKGDIQDALREERKRGKENRKQKMYKTTRGKENDPLKSTIPERSMVRRKSRRQHQM